MLDSFERFTLLISSISKKIQRIKTDEMRLIDLKSSHVSCIYYLNKFGPLTAKALCDHCQEDKALISRSIDFLEKKGYISYNSNTTKKYNCLLYLTDKGNSAALIVTNKINEAVETIQKKLTDQERVSLYSILDKIDLAMKTILDEKENEN